MLFCDSSDFLNVFSFLPLLPFFSFLFILFFLVFFFACVSFHFWEEEGREGGGGGKRAIEPASFQKPDLKNSEWGAISHKNFEDKDNFGCLRNQKSQFTLLRFTKPTQSWQDDREKDDFPTQL